jgi:hypothetical protein
LLTQDKGHAEQMRRLVDALRTGGPAPVAFDDLVHVTELTFDAAEQAASGEAVETADDADLDAPVAIAAGN